MRSGRVAQRGRNGMADGRGRLSLIEGRSFTHGVTWWKIAYATLPCPKISETLYLDTAAVAWADDTGQGTRSLCCSKR